MLAIYTGRGVAPEVNLRERISRTPPQSSNKAEPTLASKPRGDITRNQKQGYQWPQKWTCVQQKLKKKKNIASFMTMLPMWLQLRKHMFQLHILPTGYIPSIKSNIHCVSVQLILDSFFILVKNHCAFCYGFNESGWQNSISCSSGVALAELTVSGNPFKVITTN